MPRHKFHCMTCTGCFRLRPTLLLQKQKGKMITNKVKQHNKINKKRSWGAGEFKICLHFKRNKNLWYKWLHNKIRYMWMMLFFNQIYIHIKLILFFLVWEIMLYIVVRFFFHYHCKVCIRGLFCKIT